jgi:tetratricopeptide (TPR) repeat protein
MTTLGFSRPRPRAARPAAFLVAAVLVVLASYVARSVGVDDRGPTNVAGLRSGQSARSAVSNVQPPDAGTTLPVGLEQIDRSIATWTGNLRRDAKDFLAATNLAALYSARGRLTGNVDDYGRALTASKAAVAAAPDYAPGRLAETTVLLALHDFAAALASATAIYREDHGQLGALAATADAEQELGDYGAARSDLTKLAALTSGAPIDARLARLAYLTGDRDGGLALALRARDEGTSSDALAGDPSSGVFYHYQLGEMARLTGDATLAEAEYHAALALRPTDLGSLIGLAKVQAFGGRSSAAIATLRQATAIAPQPEAVALLGDLLSSSGDGAGAAREYALVREIRTLSDLAGSVYDRQLLLFELDHGGATVDVLARARSALAARHDAYGHDVVAWTLYRLGRFDEAAAESDAARSSGIVDARLLLHAGAIDIARGDADAGRTLVRKALVLGPALDPLERDEAASLLR